MLDLAQLLGQVSEQVKSMPDSLFGIVALALVFDFINGFHDAANATATVIATRTLKPVAAVCWSALFNFAALFVTVWLFGAGVAATVGAGLINLSLVTPTVIGCGLTGAIIWNLFTWWRGLPSSSSHALLGAYAGAAFAHAVLTHAALGSLYKGDAWLKVLAFIVIGPLLGYGIARTLYRMLRRMPSRDARHGDRHGDRHWRLLQLGSSALLSFSHGANDAQKTAGIIAGALALQAGAATSDLHVPVWVLILSFTTIALGTLAGGWRIVKTLGFKLASLTPQSGACAEAGAALSIALATALQLPVSSTLATTGAVSAIGDAQDSAQGKTLTVTSAKRALLRRIGLAWLLTLPAAFVAGALLCMAIEVSL